MKRLFLICLVSFVCVFGLSAQTDTQRVFRFFYEDARTDWRLDPALVSLLDSLRNVSPESRIDVTSDGYASPTGSYEQNMSLSFSRASVVADSLQALYPGTPVTARCHGVDWKGLYQLAGNGDSPYDADVRHVIETVPVHVYDGNGKLVNSRKRELMLFEGGKAWRDISEKYFPFLRRTDVTVSWECVQLPSPVKPEPVLEPVPDTSSVVITTDWDIAGEPVVLGDNEAEVFRERNRNGLVIYINLLYGLGLVPNIGTQVSLGKGWSVDTRWGYAWWSVDRMHLYWRIYGGELALRKFLGKDDYPCAGFHSLTGHHVGFYGQVFTYDIELGGHGYMGGNPEMNIFRNPQYGCGIEYGYTVALGEHFNLDFSIGAGYMGGIYHDYDPFNGRYIWRSTYRRNWFGPTRADITLQWLIGTAKNKRKEGGR